MTDRRTFVRNTALLSAAAAAAPHVAFADESKRKIRYALVGLGSLSTNQIGPQFKDCTDSELVGVVTGSPDKIPKWKEKYGIEDEHVYNYETFDQVADDDSIDVIYVVLPNSMHAEYTIRAARAGKHVFCEKPMATSSEDCRRMIQACNDNNVKLGIGYRCQFEPHHTHCVELAKNETYGKIMGIEAGFGFRIGDPTQWRLKKDLAGGGPLMDVGIYAIQSCCQLTGATPLEVAAIEVKTDPKKFAEVEETLHWSMKMPDNLACSLTTTYNYNGVAGFRAYGTNGHFGLDPAYYYDGNKGTTSDGKSIDFGNTPQFAVEMDAFSRHVRDGAPNRVPGEMGLRDLKICEAIYRSVDSGRTEPVV